MRPRAVLFACVLLTSCGGETVKEPYRSIPREVEGWVAEAQDESYDRETLYNYINGGAELYLTYAFQEAFVRRFVPAGQTDTEIVLDVYDMGSSEEAYGIFSCEREDEEIGIGQDSEYGGGLLRFWKDRYFVSITAVGEEATAKPVMLKLASAVADAIASIGERPALVSRIPTQGVRDKEIRFFHTMQCLNNHYFLANENILDLGRETRCAFAPYQRQGETGYLLLGDYGDEERASAAHQGFVSAYMPEAGEAGLARTENGRWTLAKQEGRLLKIVLDAPSAEWASSLSAEVKPEKE